MYGQAQGHEELWVPVLGGLGLSGAGGLRGRDKAGQKPDLLAEHVTIILQDWICCPLHTQYPTWAVQRGRQAQSQTGDLRSQTQS